MIALQSQAAEVPLPSEPDRAAQVVDAIGVTARQALAGFGLAVLVVPPPLPAGASVRPCEQG